MRKSFSYAHKDIAILKAVLRLSTLFIALCAGSFNQALAKQCN